MKSPVQSPLLRILVFSALRPSTVVIRTPLYSDRGSGYQTAQSMCESFDARDLEETYAVGIVGGEYCRAKACSGWGWS